MYFSFVLSRNIVLEHSCHVAFLYSPPQEGISPQKIDKYSKAYGFPVGVATLVDEVGITNVFTADTARQ